jgi:hypothetical protein
VSVAPDRIEALAAEHLTTPRVVAVEVVLHLGFLGLSALSADGRPDLTDKGRCTLMRSLKTLGVTDEEVADALGFDELLKALAAEIGGDDVAQV